METLLSRFEPSTTAVAIGYDGAALPVDASGQVSVISRTENRIELISSSKTGGLLVLSEIYYEPGWKATVNGEETPIYQTNHILRSVSVPAGNVDVIFEYDTGSWQKIRILSRVSFFSVLILLGTLSWKDKNTGPAKS
jgi:uncharacterized membrane protein YfhO